jgi:DNA N-6-adenine-methyltransferase (Dam)
MTTMKQSMQVLTTQNTTQWYTPSWLVELCRTALGGVITLDPASCAKAQETVKARLYFDGSEHQDGLEEIWGGGSFATKVFLNPPFDNTTKWVNKMISEYEAGNFSEGILLVNSAPGYKWFEALWRKYHVCMLEHRVRFMQEDGTIGGQAKKGQVVVFFGKDPTLFYQTFKGYGRILAPDYYGN